MICKKCRCALMRLIKESIVSNNPDFLECPKCFHKEMIKVGSI